VAHVTALSNYPVDLTFSIKQVIINSYNLYNHYGTPNIASLWAKLNENFRLDFEPIADYFRKKNTEMKMDSAKLLEAVISSIILGSSGEWGVVIRNGALDNNAGYLQVVTQFYKPHYQTRIGGLIMVIKLKKKTDIHVLLLH
jgi:hypothetical protein